jgi:hypothetical protein
MPKTTWTVRIVMFAKTDKLNPPIPNVWIEQLRHMGVLRVLKVLDDDTPNERTVLEFQYPGNPRGINTQIWAEQESARMKSFGIEAAAAPVWGSWEAL